MQADLPVRLVVIVAAVENVKFIPRVLGGQFDVTGAWQRDHSESVSFAFSGTAAFEGNVDFFRTVPSAEHPERYAEALAGVSADFSGWHARGRMGWMWSRRATAPSPAG